MTIVLKLELHPSTCAADAVAALVALANMGVRLTSPVGFSAGALASGKRELRSFVCDEPQDDLAAFVRRVVHEAEVAGVRIVRAFASVAEPPSPPSDGEVVAVSRSAGP